MSEVPRTEETPERWTAPCRRILVALDNSDHAGRALAESIRLAGFAGGTVTGIHAYAARLHDRRFRQMEGGLPARYLAEAEMSHQREVHDDLITRGLDIISDSYHDVAEKSCRQADVPYRRLSPEGKNYRRIVEAVGSGDFDLLVLGALGVGAVPGGTVGTVCERVVRRSPIDVLVVRDPARALDAGPIVVGLDGSPRSFGALLGALDLGRRLGAVVHAVAAYDPYYHYVAFRRISGVLSEEAGKVFRFKEQEQLHEELIDEGIARIYRSHLEVAARIAGEDGVELVTELLDGKPYRTILGYLEKVGAGLLMVGRTGIHADSALDIGGNAENLLRLAPCHVWFVAASYEPPLEMVAAETVAWSPEAEELLSRAPEFARDMARQAVLRHAHEQGHTFITTDIVGEVANRLMPGRGEAACPHGAAEPAWSAEASALIEGLDNPALAANVRLRAEKLARREGAETVLASHLRPFIDDPGEGDLAPWSAAALACLARVPEAVRERVRARVETVARNRGAGEVTPEIVEAGFAEARQAMHRAMLDGGHKRTVDDGE